MTNEEILVLWEELSAPTREVWWAMFFILRDSIKELKEEARELGLEFE